MAEENNVATSLRGKYADIPVSSQDLIRERQEEVAREEHKFQECFEISKGNYIGKENNQKQS
jgi:hypothetical protein